MHCPAISQQKQQFNSLNMHDTVPYHHFIMFCKPTEIRQEVTHWCTGVHRYCIVLYSFIVQVDRTQLILHTSSFAYTVYL